MNTTPASSDAPLQRPYYLDFGDVWCEIERLIAVNARHRKGFRLQEIGNDDFVLSQAQDEMRELIEAHDRYVSCAVGSDRKVAIELGDLLGVLFHFAIRMGYTPDSLARLMLDKFKQRFEASREQRC